MSNITYRSQSSYDSSYHLSVFVYSTFSFSFFASIVPPLLSSPYFSFPVLFAGWLMPSYHLHLLLTVHLHSSPSLLLLLLLIIVHLPSSSSSLLFFFSSIAAKECLSSRMRHREGIPRCSSRPRSIQPALVIFWSVTKWVSSFSRHSNLWNHWIVAPCYLVMQSLLLYLNPLYSTSLYFTLLCFTLLSTSFLSSSLVSSSPILSSSISSPLVSYLSSLPPSLTLIL